MRPRAAAPRRRPARRCWPPTPTSPKPATRTLATAKNLQAAIDAFLAAPGAATHQAAKDAWLAARVPYQQTEAYRFGNAIVDDWEGRVNAWPWTKG